MTAPDLAAALGMWALKGTIALALALLLVRLAARAPAALRHGMLIAGLGSALLLPLLAALVPGWNLPLMPVPWVSGETNEAHAGYDRSHATRSVHAGESEYDRRLEATLHPGDPSGLTDDAAAAEPRAEDGVPTIDVRRSGARGWLPIATLLVWALGVMTVLGRWTLGIARASRIVKAARPVSVARARRGMREARVRAQCSARVRLLESDAIDVPVAWGLGSGEPAIVLPLGASQWPSQRLAAVLDHEMAHLTRRDAWTQLLAQAAVAVHWFDPLAWIAYGQALREREHAADDVVLALGAPAVGYAETLLGIAAATRRAPAAATAFLLPGNGVEHRVRRMLDRGLDRRPLTRRGRAFLGVTALCAALPLAAMQPAPADPGEPSTSAGPFWGAVDRDRATADARVASMRTSVAASDAAPVSGHAMPRPPSVENDDAFRQSAVDAPPAGSGAAVDSVGIVQEGIDEARGSADIQTMSAWMGLEPRPGDPWCETHNGRPWLQRSCEVRDFVIPASDIDVDAGQNGTVDVRRWDRLDVLVSVRVEAQAASPEAALRLQRRIAVELENGRIRPLIPELDRDEWASASVRLYVPRQTDLSITTFNGDIRITGVAGDLTLRSHNGRMDLADVGGDVRGRTVNGDIVLLPEGPSWRGRGAHLVTTAGGVTLLLPDRYAADLEVTTLTGGFSIENLPFGCNPPGGECSSKRVLESLNGGGARVRIETSSGGVHLGRRH